MTDDVNPKTDDLTEILAGRTFPTKQVPVFFDEDKQYKLDLLDKALRALESRTDDESVAQWTEIRLQREALLQELKAHKYTVHLKGIPRRLKQGLITSILAEFPQETETNFLGQKTVKDNPEADEAYANRRWALHIEKMEYPDGRVRTGDENLAVFLRGEAPDPAIIAIEYAIQELDSGSQGGYEAAVQDLDF